MKCELIRSLMSSYIDKDINEIDRISVEKHLQQCSECREDYELLLEVVNQCSNIDEVELPYDFHEELHQKLLLEQQNTKTKFKIMKLISKYRWKAASGLVAAVLIFAIAINGAPLFKENSKQDEIAYTQNKDVASDYSMNNSTNGDNAFVAPATEQAQRTDDESIGFSVEETPQVTTAQEPTSNSNTGKMGKEDSGIADGGNFTVATIMQAPSRATTARLVIKSGNLTIKVANLDSKVNDIKSITEESGGYVENSQVNNNAANTIKYMDEESGKVIEETTVKSASMVIRVPQDQFDNIFNSVKLMGKLEHESIVGDDITLQYIDTEATVANFKIKEQKLQELMTSKADTVEEILKIESELNEVRTSIDILSGDIKRWDNLVQLSSIYIDLTEVKETELNSEVTGSIWDQSIKGFKGTVNRIGITLEKAFVLFVASIPIILMFGIPLIIMALIIKRKRTVRN